MLVYIHLGQIIFVGPRSMFRSCVNGDESERFRVRCAMHCPMGVPCVGPTSMFRSGVNGDELERSIIIS